MSDTPKDEPFQLSDKDRERMIGSEVMAAWRMACEALGVDPFAIPWGQFSPLVPMGKVIRLLAESVVDTAFRHGHINESFVERTREPDLKRWIFGNEMLHAIPPTADPDSDNQYEAACAQLRQRLRTLVGEDLPK